MKIHRKDIAIAVLIALIVTIALSATPASADAGPSTCASLPNEAH